jgi:prophage tail gpP-like protein
MSIADVLASAQLSALHKQLQQKGRLPKIDIVCEPLTGGKATSVNSFLEYHFSSNILVPVDSFSFTFSAPNDTQPVTRRFSEGDIISIYANDVQISTGIIDSIEIDVDAENGERITLQGRDLMGQLTDQHCVTLDCKPIWGNELTIEAVCDELIQTTRIKGYITQDAPTQAFLFATEPNESRLNALLRFLEPLNCLSWMSPDGMLTVGRPDFSSNPVGTLMCNKAKRKSNVLNMSASRSATQIPSVIAGLYADVQKELVGLPKEQVFTNSNSRVQELKKRGHQIFRAVTSSVPSGATPEDFRSVAELQVAKTPQTMLAYMAAREFARANANVLQVKAVVPGHFNDSGQPYMPDTLYTIDFDRAGVNEVMYCYGVEWSLSPSNGQTSVLSFCPVNTLVAGAKAL